MTYNDRKNAPPYIHPLAQVAAMVADDVRQQLDEVEKHVEPIAWLTEHGELFCRTCVNPPQDRRDRWEPILPDSPGKADTCDLCGLFVLGAGFP